MASLRFLTCARLIPIWHSSYIKSRCNEIPSVFQVQKRGSRYNSSPKYDENAEYVDFEISQDPREWMYVEQLLPVKVVPKPVNSESVDGWKAQKESAKHLPYFVHRSKNYMQPVYMQKSYRGMRTITVLRKIDGNIWTLEKELKEYVEDKLKKRVATQVHEFAGYIRFKTDCVSIIKEWLNSKGL